MVELQKVADISEKIKEYLGSRRAKQKSPSTSSNTQNARILGQEKDGGILYTWDDVTDSSEGAVVTHFAVYDSVTDTHSVVHVHNQRVYTVSCTINKERTLLAFTVLTKDGGSVSSQDKRGGREKYSAYLAEIRAPNPRVFSLNLERDTFLKVQFLHEDKGSEKETFMVVMLHRESIGLYKIQLGRVVKGVVMKGQPRTEQIAKKFVWCQWDGINQQLFYIHHERKNEGERQHILSCVQFYANAQYDNVLDVPLNFPITSRSSGRSTYADIPLHYGIPDLSLNVCVLTQSDGTFCICYQHRVPTSDRRSKSSPLPRTSPLQRASPLQHPSPSYQASPTGSDGDVTEINYYVCMVHHAKTLHGCVSCIPANIARKAVVHFSWLGDNILVMLPGHFVHLLNVGMEFEPCHHILLHNKTYGNSTSDHTVTETTMENQSAERAVENQPEGGGDQSDNNSAADASWEKVTPVMSLEAEHLSCASNSMLFSAGKEPLGSYVFDWVSGIVYKVQVNLSSLTQVFMDCYMPTTRSALLHYVVMRTRNLKLLKKLFLVLCNDITSPEVPSLMSEFLIGMTYAGVRRQTDREPLSLLPFTYTESLRGQFDKTADGERLARVSYSDLRTVNIGTRTARERQQRRGMVADDMLDSLRRHLRMMQITSSQRFMYGSVRKTYKQFQAEEMKKTKANGKSQDEESFLSTARIYRSKTQRPPRKHVDPVALSSYTNQSDRVLGEPPSFLQGNSVTEASEKVNDLTREILGKHLSKDLPPDAKVKSSNVAKEYVQCQVQQSRLLCHLLFSLRGRPDINTNLCEEGSLEDYELFQLMERYSLTLQEIAFPVPQGFPSFLTRLAFRCLPLREFLQYVNSGAVQLTGDFMSQLLIDLPDDEEHCRVKQLLISKLPQSSAEECYRQWSHPICTAYFGHQTVTDILTDSSRRVSSGSHDFYRAMSVRSNQSTNIVDDIKFQPLAAFLRHLHVSDQRASHHGGRRENPLNIASLEEVALYHTSHETQYDMGTVNF